MIEMSMYVGTGFLLASLSMLAILPLVHNRAVRLTTRRMEGCIPSSMAEILADKDLLRAEFSMSTRRLETEIERLSTKNARQLAELGRKGDAINSLKRELSALRDEMRPTEEELAINAAALEQAKRALFASESELGWRTQDLAESLAFAESRKIEIDALRIEGEALKQRLEDARNEMKATEDRHNAAAQKAARVLAEKETELAKRTEELSERSSSAESRTIEIIALKSEAEALNERLNSATKELELAERRRYAAAQEAERVLVDKESQLAKRTQELAERSASAESQENENITLKTEVQSLQERLNGARAELKVLSDRRDAERTAAVQKLAEERGKFEKFRCRVADLVEQVTLQNAQEKVIAGRAQELEERLSTQLRMLDEREAEVRHLSREVEIAREAEADLHAAITKMEDRENVVAQNLTAEKAELQAALERVNGERVRLSYEVTDLRRRLKENWASAQNEISPLNGDTAARERAA